MPNDIILRNIRDTVESAVPVVIRIPVVPEHNHTQENMIETARFIVGTLKNRVKQVQLLRYRELGTEKYRALGLPYPMSGSAIPEQAQFEKQIRDLVDLMQSYGAPAVAGTTTPF